MFSQTTRQWLQVACLTVLFCAGCSEQSAPRKGIVSLSPTLTETLFALGLGAELVGRSDYCKFPAEAESLPTMGSSLTPQFEALIDANPEMILYEQHPSSPNNDIKKIGPSLGLPWLTLEDAAQSIRELGKRFNRTNQAEALAGRFENTLKSDPPSDSPSLLLLLYGGSSWDADWWFIRRNSLHGSAIHAAGYRNAMDQDIDGASMISVEQLLTLNPDVIIALSTDHDNPEQLESDFVTWITQLDSLDAVRHRRVGLIASSHFHQTGPGILEFVPALQAKLQSLNER